VNGDHELKFSTGVGEVGDVVVSYNFLMKRIFFVEGIPGAGKTSLLSALSFKYQVIPEVLDNDQLLVKHNKSEQGFFLLNDERKLRMGEQAISTCFIDRSPFSTVFFNVAKFSLDIDHPISAVLSWYEKRVRPIIFNPASSFRLIYLDIDPKESLARKRSEEIQDDPWRDLQSLYQIRSLYLSLSKKYSNQVCFVDGKLHPNQLLKKVEEYVQLQEAESHN